MNDLDHLLRGASVYDDFLDTLRVTVWRTPEHELLAAVLEDAVICYTGVIGANPWQRRCAADDAREWFCCCDETPWPFSFLNIMATLLPDVGLDTFRRRVLAQRQPGIAPGYAGYKGGHRRSLDVHRSLVGSRARG